MSDFRQAKPSATRGSQLAKASSYSQTTRTPAEQAAYAAEKKRVRSARQYALESAAKERAIVFVTAILEPIGANLRQWSVRHVHTGSAHTL